jgi:hypothetical protein
VFDGYVSYLKNTKCYQYRDGLNELVLTLRVEDIGGYKDFDIPFATYTSPLITSREVSFIKKDFINIFYWHKNPKLPKEESHFFDGESYINKILYSEEFLEFLRQKFRLNNNVEIVQNLKMPGVFKNIPA